MKVVCNDKEKAEAFNSFFLKSSDIDDHNIPKPEAYLQAGQILQDILITKKEELDLLKCLDVNKASGLLDIVNHTMLKMPGGVIMPMAI